MYYCENELQDYVKMQMWFSAEKLVAPMLPFTLPAALKQLQEKNI